MPEGSVPPLRWTMPRPHGNHAGLPEGPIVACISGRGSGLDALQQESSSRARELYACALGTSVFFFFLHCLTENLCHHRNTGQGLNPHTQTTVPVESEEILQLQ